MAEQKKNVSLWIEPELLQALDAIAQKDDRSRNWEIVQAIRAWVNLKQTEESWAQRKSREGRTCAVATLNGEWVEESTGGL